MRLFFLIISWLCFGEPALAGKRVALVIGNASYESAGRLSNTINDAREMGRALERTGFDVAVEIDVTAAAFEKALENFNARAHGADVALFFYAGHALQVGPTNYLMPVDAKLQSEYAVKRETISAQDIVERMEGSARVNLVFLDACRDNPLANELRGKMHSSGRTAMVGRGLSRIENVGSDTLIVYSAAPGQVAADISRLSSSHSPFTAAMLANLEIKGVEIETMMKRVTQAVRDATGGGQRPERLSHLGSDFYFLKGVESVPPPPQPQSATVIPEVPTQPPPPPVRQRPTRAPEPEATMGPPPSVRGCIVTDPTGTPLNVRSTPQGNIVGTLQNGSNVRVVGTARDYKGQQWANVTSGSRSLGWVIRRFISCE